MARQLQQKGLSGAWQVNSTISDFGKSRHFVPAQQSVAFGAKPP
jgi:hypothetical protein